MQSVEVQKTVGDNWRDIIDPNFYTRAGWPSDWVNTMHRSHQTESGAVLGVWHAEFLEQVCKALEIPEDRYETNEGLYKKCKAMALQIWLEFYKEEEFRGRKEKQEADSKNV